MKEPRLCCIIWMLLFLLFPGTDQSQVVAQAVNSRNIILATTDLYDFGNRDNVMKISRYDTIMNPSGGQVMQMEMTGMGSDWPTYAVAIGGTVKGKVEEGDNMLLEFWARCLWTHDETAEGKMRLQMKASQYSLPSRPISLVLTYGQEWKHFLIPIQAMTTYALGDCFVTFNFGEFRNQAIQITGFTLKTYKICVDFDDLPKEEITYTGMEEDAPWRAEAADRIEQHRKADMRVTVRDSAGAAIQDAEVHVKLVNHAFNVTGSVCGSALQNYEDYDEKALELFNSFVSVVGFIPHVYQFADWRNNLIPPMVDWVTTATDRNMQAMHMVWGRWDKSPQYWKEGWDAGNGKEWLKEQILGHMRDIMTTYKGRIREYIVLNEPYHHQEWTDIFGTDVIFEWFDEARRLDSTAILILNDNSILSGEDQVHKDFFFELCEYLLIENDCEIDQIGMQGHFGTPVPPEKLYSILEKYDTTFHKPLQITEFESITLDKDLQERYTRDAVTIFFSHPAVTRITHFTWHPHGCTANPQAGMFDEDGNYKPNGEMWLKLWNEIWMTDEILLTDSNGKVELRGFLGDYAITVTKGEEIRLVTTTLGKEGRNVECIL